MKKTVDGVELTDDVLDAWADEAERGEVGNLIIMRPQGRPRIFAEELDTISFKLPHSLRLQLDAQAKNNGKTRSDFVRTAIEKELLATA
ncbi:MAG: toxin-antitoxin system antitoxin subunit [Actinomycetaceae bacterium]|nr:toxin-antitoxin system antitoxin subunit [Actinomycetaceae bacterium]